MNYQEAIKIAEMCRPDKFGADYPPTNPAVLLEAARVIYLEEGTTVKVSVIVKWLESSETGLCPEEAEGYTKDIVVFLHTVYAEEY